MGPGTNSEVRPHFFGKIIIVIPWEPIETWGSTEVLGAGGAKSHRLLTLKPWATDNVKIARYLNDCNCKPTESFGTNELVITQKPLMRLQLPRSP